MISCAMDMRGYLGVLDADTRVELGQQLAKRTEQATADLAALQQQPTGGDKSAQLNLLRRQIAAHQVCAAASAP